MDDITLTTITSERQNQYNFNYGRQNRQDKMTNNTNNKDNESRYVDYDNRPIKPLDTNLLNKQLTEYPEMSPEEMEKMKERYVFCLYFIYIV